jgi:hypothetical protein
VELLAGASMFVVLLWLAVVVLVIASFWIVFTKAGHPGWACLIPIYNVIVLLQIARKPLWWIILMIIPLVNIVIGILVVIEIAKNFGKSAGFGIGMLFLPFVFYPILAWSDARYQPQT